MCAAGSCEVHPQLAHPRRAIHPLWVLVGVAKSSGRSFTDPASQMLKNDSTNCGFTSRLAGISRYPRGWERSFLDRGLRIGIVVGSRVRFVSRRVSSVLRLMVRLDLPIHQHEVKNPV